MKAGSSGLSRKQMRRQDLEITEIDQIDGIISRAFHCCIGMVDGGEPYIVPVCFGYERNALYFHSALEGKKVDILKRSNRVCFEMDTDLEVVGAAIACEWSMKYRSVMGTGTVHILETDEDKSHGLELIIRHYARDDSSPPEEIPANVLVVRIDIDSISGRSTY
jgi:nitroimidazol reductase NimA-like FMN-containing flavoprotein (pyridoxamine 5'-phosphate oxidase superfamily)